MQTFEIILSLAAVSFAGLVHWLLHHIVKTSGRDRPRDSARVQKLVDRVNQYSEGLPELPIKPH